jgi:hypothetical protein
MLYTYHIQPLRPPPSSSSPITTTTTITYNHLSTTVYNLFTFSDHTCIHLFFFNHSCILYHHHHHHYQINYIIYSCISCHHHHDYDLCILSSPSSIQGNLNIVFADTRGNHSLYQVVITFHYTILCMCVFECVFICSDYLYNRTREEECAYS